MKKKITNWNHYPSITAEFYEPRSVQECISFFNQSNPIIPRGAGKSYGDASLNEAVISTVLWDRILNLDEQDRTITLESGVLLSTLLDFLKPYSLLPPVLPGTQYITIGGAIAANVHGKNHTHKGSFSECVVEMTLLDHLGSIRIVSRSQDPDLFYATLGGMGLTGIILTAKIKLIKLDSYLMRSKAIRFFSFAKLLTSFQQSSMEYNVAWIDVFSWNEDTLNAIFLESEFLKIPGDHVPENSFNRVYRKRQYNIPFYFPGWIMHRRLIKIANRIKFILSRYTSNEKLVYYESFLFPLDKIKNWNRMYGKTGFIQYQFVIPLAGAEKGIQEIIHEIQKTGIWVALCSLKRLKKIENCSPLSFAEDGFTLALDFKISHGLFELLDRLDQIVIRNQGKVYLAKDARLKSESFHKMYSVPPVRFPKFSSLLSLRIRLNGN